MTKAQIVHVSISSATSTAYESKHEGHRAIKYLTQAGKIGTLPVLAMAKHCKRGISTVHTVQWYKQYEYKYGQDRYIARAGHAKTLYNGYNHSTHSAKVQEQDEYKHGQGRDIARAAHAKTLYKRYKHSTQCAMVQPQYLYKHGQDRYIARTGLAKTLYKRYKHSKLCAMVQAQCEYKHGQDRYIARASHAKTLYKGYKHITHRAIVQAQYVRASRVRARQVHRPCWPRQNTVQVVQA